MRSTASVTSTRFGWRHEAIRHDLSRALDRVVSAALMQRSVFLVLAAAGAFQALQVGMALLGDRRLIFTNWDFPAFYAAGELVARGSGHLLYDVEAMRMVELEAAGEPVGGTGVLPFFNPAFFALVFVPLSWMDLLPAYGAWTAFSLVLLFVNASIVWRLTRTMPRAWRVGLLAGFVTLVPVSYGLEHGQFSLMLVTSWVAAFLLLRDGRERAAGVALAPLLIKPELLIPVAMYIAWRRQWRVLQTLLPLTALAVAVSVAVTGVDAAIAYPAFLLESTGWEGQGVTTAVMFGWNGIVAMVLHEPSAPSTRIVVGALMAATVAVCAFALRRFDEASARGCAGAQRRFAMQWVVLTAATILLDPHFYLQDTVLLAVPAIALIADAEPYERPRLAALFGAGWCLLALGTVPNQYLHVNLFAVYMVGVGALLCGPLIRGATRQRLIATGAPQPALA